MSLVRFHARFIRRCKFADDLQEYPEGWIYRAWLPGLFIKVRVYRSRKVEAECRRKTERLMRYWGLK